MIREYSLYIFDLDGVLYLGETAVPGAVEVVRELRQRAQIRYLTNNATRTREEFAEKLTRLGFPASPEDIASSAWAAAQVLKGAEVYVVGEPGLCEELLRAGCTVYTSDCKPQTATYVLVGACWSFTYDMLDTAQHLIRKGAEFVATNLDKTYPVEDRVKPGAGAIVAAVAAAAGKEPDVVIGKPEPTLVRLLMESAGVLPEETLVVGDQLDTDIAAAKNANCDSALVLTGITREATGEPTYVIKTIDTLLTG